MDYKTGAFASRTLTFYAAKKKTGDLCSNQQANQDS
jgi:hypothetical protein